MEFLFGAVFFGIIIFAIWRGFNMIDPSPIDNKNMWPPNSENQDDVAGRVTGTVIHVDKEEKSSSNTTPEGS